jgi:hypothetical protein
VKLAGSRGLCGEFGDGTYDDWGRSGGINDWRLVGDGTNDDNGLSPGLTSRLKVGKGIPGEVN